MIELGQGERCDGNHISAKLVNARLKYQDPRGPEEFDPCKKGPGSEPENQERFDQPERRLAVNPYPTALTPDFLPRLWWRETDDVVLHIDCLNFNSRTRLR